MTAITDKKLRDKIMKEKNIGTEENNRTNKAKYVGEKEQKEYNTGSFDINKRKTHNKSRADSTNGKIRNKTGKRKLRKPNMLISQCIQLDTNTQMSRIKSQL